MQHTRGRYTEEATNRSAEMSGEYFRTIQGVLGKELGDTTVQHKSDAFSNSADVLQFVKCYKDDGLFSHQRGREHQTFPQFKHRFSLRQPEKLGAQLASLSSAKEKWQNIKA